MNISMTSTGLLFFLAAINWAIGAPQTFVLDDPKGLNSVEFRSKAPLELIVGRTNVIGGTVTFDHEDLSQPFTALIKVDLRTLSTDNATRDQHMRENYLHTDQYPWAVFQASGKIKTPSLRLMDGETAEVKPNGNLTIHGVTKEIEVSGIARYFAATPHLEKLGFPGDVFRFEGSFSVNLKDFNIDRPQLLVLKLSERQEVFIAFTATTKWAPKEP
ncbi:MAG: YceI family protein [bacterium]